MAPLLMWHSCAATGRCLSMKCGKLHAWQIVGAALRSRPLVALVLAGARASACKSRRQTPLARSFSYVMQMRSGISSRINTHRPHCTTSAAMTASPERSRFSGEWKKDAAKSDPLDCACDALQLQGMVRGALGKMDRMFIECYGDKVRTRTPLPRVLFIPLGAVVEEFPVGGEEKQHKRRDNRSGQFKGRLVTQPGGGFAINSHWSEPLAGSATDTYALSSDGNTLTIKAELNVEGRTCCYSTVYQRVK